MTVLNKMKSNSGIFTKTLFILKRVGEFWRG